MSAHKYIISIIVVCLFAGLSTVSATNPYTFVSEQVGSTPTNGYVLQTDGTNSTWVDSSTFAGATVLNELTDVTLTSTSTNDMLYIDGTGKWVNSQLQTLWDLGWNASTTLESVTSIPNLATVGALNSGSITSGFGSIDIGASNFTTTGIGSLGTLTVTGAATSTIAGYFDVAKGIEVGTNKAFWVHENATANTLVVTDGNVGIGTTGPNYSLDVNGKIHALTDLYIGNRALSATSTATTSGATLMGIPTLDDATWNTQYSFNNLFASAGLASGGDITDNGDQTIAVSAGTGFIKAVDSDVAELTSFNWTASSTISVPTGTVRYIGISYNSGSPIIVSETDNVWDYDTEFPLGSAINQSGAIYINDNPWKSTDSITNTLESLRAGFGYVYRDKYEGGLIIGVTGTRNPTLSAGKLHSNFTEHDITTKDCSGADTFYSWWRDGAGSWTRNSTASSTYTVTHYDNNSGYPVLLTANRYASWWVWTTVDGGGNGQLMLVYPQNQYTTIAGALGEEMPTFPTNWYEHGEFLGRIIIQQGQDDPVEIESAYTQTFQSAIASDHANLSNLAWTSSGHTGTASTFAGFDGAGVASEYTESNYILTNGTRPMSGSLKMGANNILTSGTIYATSTDFTTLTVTGTATSTNAGNMDIEGDLEVGSSFYVNSSGQITSGEYLGTAIANDYLANSTISGISLGSNLADLTATDGTLTFSGSYNGGTARTVGLNLGNANTWTALQTFGNASSTLLSVGTELWLGTATTTGTNGIDISGGCFAVNGTCVGGGGAGSGTVTQIDTTFPILGGPITTTGTIALAFGTTTANSWSEIQTFNNSVKIGASIGGVLDISYGSDKIATFDRIDSPAVNYLGFYSNIAGDSPIIYAGGADTNIDLEFIPKGNGRVTLPNGNNFSTTGTVFATTTNTDALTVNTTITAPAGFAGRSTTINGTALDADAELYTSGFEFTIATTTTMATTTQELTYQCTNDLTITKVSGFCSETATTTVGLDIRNEYTPKIAGSDVFDDLFEIGDYSATTTFTTTSCSAGQWINLDVDGYFIGSPLNCYLKVQFTNDD